MDDTGRTLLLIGVIFLAVGAIQLGLGVFFFLRTRRFLRTAVSTTGTIVDLTASSGLEGETVYDADVVHAHAVRRPRTAVLRARCDPDRRRPRGMNPT